MAIWHQAYIQDLFATITWATLPYQQQGIYIHHLSDRIVHTTIFITLAGGTSNSLMELPGEIDLSSIAPGIMHHGVT